MEASQLLSNISVLMPEDAAGRVVIPLAMKLTEDPSFKIRKAVATNFGLICKAVGNDTAVKSLLPLFLKLSGDEIWGVRKACAESLVAVAEALNLPARVETLVPLFEKLIEDVSFLSFCYCVLIVFFLDFLAISMGERGLLSKSWSLYCSIEL
jgi:serine/threonine-protein phosphatase 4 regulatory subunit 1